MSEGAPAMRVVTRSPLECHQTKKQRLFGGLAMTTARQNEKRRIVRTTSQSLTGNCLRERPQPRARNENSARRFAGNVNDTRPSISSPHR
jgi:hypothetical protein